MNRFLTETLPRLRAAPTRESVHGSSRRFDRLASDLAGEHGSLGHDSGVHVAPQIDQELARHGDDADPPLPFAAGGEPSAVPA